MTHLVETAQAAGQVAADADPAEVAKVLVGGIMGYIVQRLLIGNVEPDSYTDALAALVGQKKENRS